MRLRNVPGAREAIAENRYCVQEPEKYKGSWRAKLFQNDNPLHVEIGMGKGDFIIELAMQNPDINYIGIEKFSSVLFRAIEKLGSINEESVDNEPVINISDETGSIESADAVRAGKTSDQSCSSIIDNLYFIRFDATELETIFADGEVDRIYLNFSDPWPKDRHAKRRLTSPQFLEIYDSVLSKNNCSDHASEKVSEIDAGGDDGNRTVSVFNTDKSDDESNSIVNSQERGLIQFKTDNRTLFDYSVDIVNESDIWEIREITYDLHHSDQLAGNVMTEYEKKFVAAGHPICRFVISRKTSTAILK